MADPKVIASHIDIANLGLERCGHKELADFDDPNFLKTASLIRNSYDNIIKLVMEQMPWDFCTVFKSLTAITLPDEAWGYTAAFNLPANTLRPYAVQGQRSEPGGEWIRRGNRIFSNTVEADGTINTQLIMYEPNVGLYPPTFIDAVAARCAAEWAGPLIRVASEVERLEMKAKDRFRDAASSDGGVGSVRRQEVYASVVSARSGGARFPFT